MQGLVGIKERAAYDDLLLGKEWVSDDVTGVSAHPQFVWLLDRDNVTNRSDRLAFFHVLVMSVAEDALV